MSDRHDVGEQWWASCWGSKTTVAFLQRRSCWWEWPAADGPRAVGRDRCDSSPFLPSRPLVSVVTSDNCVLRGSSVQTTTSGCSVRRGCGRVRVTCRACYTGTRPARAHEQGESASAPRKVRALVQRSTLAAARADSCPRALPWPRKRGDRGVPLSRRAEERMLETSLMRRVGENTVGRARLRRACVRTAAADSTRAAQHGIAQVVGRFLDAGEAIVDGIRRPSQTLDLREDVPDPVAGLPTLL